MLSYILENKEFFALLIPVIVAFIPLITFLISKSKEQKLINFKILHDSLMKGLANQDTSTGLDQQIAILYELRNYPEYYPLIKRLLSYKIDWWKSQLKEKPHFQQLISEAEETIKYTQQSKWKRRFNKNS